jgi:hypothetical protein
MMTAVESEHIISEAKKLLLTVQQSSGETRLNAVKDLWKLCEKPDSKDILSLNEDLSLLLSLKQLLETIKDDDNCLSWIVLCISWLSVGDISSKAAISSKELALLPVFMKILRSSPDETMSEWIEITISNCSDYEGCHDYLLSSEIGWLDYVETRLKEKPNHKKSYWRLVNFICNMRNENIPFLIDRKVPELVLQKMLCYGSDEMIWSNDDGEVMGNVIKFVMYFSKSMNGSRYLRSFFNLHPHYTAFLFTVLPTSSMASARTMIIVANVYGREENNERTQALLSSHPDILPLLIDIMDAIMNWDVNRTEIKELIKKGFYYGFQLSVVAIALRNLSISDENKKIMIKYPKLIRLACQGIRLFIDNAPECKGMNPGETFYDRGGGGGKDQLTIENLLELLVQWSFCSESIDDVKFTERNLWNPSYDVKKMMEDILDLPGERNLSFEARQFAQLLVNVHPSQKKEEAKDVAAAGRSLQQHIMLSYCWAANKPLVVAFGRKLREMGYDVFRDDEGSGIMGPISMKGNILEAMAEAVDKSYTMIIFVSPEYKESTNCRIEGRYGFKRARTGKLQILYVMMRENYHMEVDGWLGAIVGAELWYPLWKENQLEPTVTAIAEKIGDNALAVANVIVPGSPVKATVLVTSFPPSVSASSFPSRLRETIQATYKLELDAEADFVAALNV